MTTDTTPDLDILIRIEKLLAQSEDPSCTTPEREAFQNKAFELMARHRIDRSQVGGHLAKDDVIETQVVGDFNGIYGRLRIEVVQAVAEANDIKLFWNGYKNFRHLKAYGFKSDLDRCIPLMHRLVADADLQVKLIEKSYDMKDTLRQRRGFYDGYADAISGRLLVARIAAEQQAASEGVDVAGTSLVLVDRARQVNDSLRQNMGNLRKAGGLNDTGHSGYGNGHAAGTRADLSNRNQVGSRKALGR